MSKSNPASDGGTKSPYIISRRFALTTVPLLVLALSACATPFRADVNRFQQLPVPQGQSFTITSDDPALRGGIEFAQYAGLVAQEMADQGYVYARDPAMADMVVTMNYSVNDGREKVITTGGGFGGFGGGFGGFGGGFGRFGGGFGRGGFGGPFAFGFHDPFIFGNGFNDVRSYTVFTTGLEMRIDRAADNVRLFEGRAEAQSRAKSLQRVVPNLVEAIFTEFPGQSGETLRISIAPDEVKVRNINR